jgi:hypothetical protein
MPPTASEWHVHCEPTRSNGHTTHIIVGSQHRADVARHAVERTSMHSRCLVEPAAAVALSGAVAGATRNTVTRQTP